MLPSRVLMTMVIGTPRAIVTIKMTTPIVMITAKSRIFSSSPKTTTKTNGRVGGGGVITAK